MKYTAKSIHLYTSNFIKYKISTNFLCNIRISNVENILLIDSETTQWVLTFTKSGITT